MARPLRIELAGGLYHVTARGDRREAIYFDEADRLTWLKLLGDVCGRFNWRCHAYCQMTNHYHVVIETPDGNLSRGMRQLNGVYTQYINRRYRRVGHVFQGRYGKWGQVLQNNILTLIHCVEQHDSPSHSGPRNGRQSVSSCSHPIGKRQPSPGFVHGPAHNQPADVPALAVAGVGPL